jgi:hypothetical protein
MRGVEKADARFGFQIADLLESAGCAAWILSAGVKLPSAATCRKHRLGRMVMFRVISCQKMNEYIRIIRVVR